MNGTEPSHHRIAGELSTPVRIATELATQLGLDPDPVNFWIVDNDEMNQLIAYEGFQERYPHWRWGMQYERTRATDRYFGGKAFELVNNDDPAHAFLQASNSLTDQKAVITHVLAHSDFFANNRWFDLFDAKTDATAMLARHADRIESFMTDPEIGRETVERWIDHVLCLQDNIDQHAPYTRRPSFRESDSTNDVVPLSDAIDEIGLRDEVREAIFGDDWVAAHDDSESTIRFPVEPEADLLAFLREFGHQYDRESNRSTEMETWQREVIDMLRREAYYFAPQRMTKVMNEGWASYWESVMMTEAGFADANEFIAYADHQSKILGSAGLNPYKLGRTLWEYIENRANRREVVSHLLQVDGIEPSTFHDEVDFEFVLQRLEPDPRLETLESATLDEIDSLPDRFVNSTAVADAEAGELDLNESPWAVLSFEGLAERHYSLVKPQNRGFLGRIDSNSLEDIARYIFDDTRYSSVEAAVDAVDRAAGWTRMFEVRSSHNDVTFIDEFLTQEFVDENHFFTYEYAKSSDDYRVTSTDIEAVKKKLLLTFTNFGKPRTRIYDANYRNRNELLLGHDYNGIQIDLEQARQTLERVFELWGRPVNLMTIVQEVSEKDLELARRRNSEPKPTERGIRIRYDGDTHTTEDLEADWFDRIAADDIDYNTTPESWYT